MATNVTDPLAGLYIGNGSSTQKKTTTPTISNKSTSTVGSDGLNGVYWLGSNGNIYTKDNAGAVVDRGKSLATYDTGFDTESISSGSYRKIDDPNPGNGGSLNTTDVSVGGTGSSYTDTSAARGATQKSIDSLDTILKNNLGSISGNYKSILDKYATEDAAAKASYDTQVSTNESNRTSMMQQALLAAAQGGRGLMSTLAALGALGGTGRDLANRAVAASANADIGEGDRTFKTNAEDLMTSWSKTQQDQEDRKAEAEAARANEEAAARKENLQTRQSLYEKMASLWSDAGNNSEAARFLGLVGELAPQIASNTSTRAAAYKPSEAAFTPGKLQSYLAGAKDMTVTTQGGNKGSSLTSPLAAVTRKREEVV